MTKSLSTLAVVLVALSAACDGDLRQRNVTASDVEHETSRAIERGATFVERKTERTADAIRDKLDRLDAREHEVRGIRAARKPNASRDEFDDAMDAVHAKSKQLEERYQDLKQRASEAGDDVKRELETEWVQLENELDQLQRSLNDMEREIRADKRR